MSGRGFTIRVERIAAMRELAAAIRDKKADFEKQKKAYPKKFAADKKAAIAELSRLRQQVAKAKSNEELNRWYEVEWKSRTNLFSPPPTLNVCSEMRAVQMLEMDSRKTVSINSNSHIWALLEGKCEVVR